MGDSVLQLAWNNHAANLCDRLATLREKECYSDVTLCAEGRFYPLHRLVLSACSEYLARLLEGAATDKPLVVFSDIRSRELEALIQYMYAGEVSVAQQHLPPLIRAAELLCIKGLAVPDAQPQPHHKRDNPDAHTQKHAAKHIHKPDTSNNKANTSRTSTDDHQTKRQSIEDVREKTLQSTVLETAGATSEGTLFKHSSHGVSQGRLSSPRTPRKRNHEGKLDAIPVQNIKVESQERLDGENEDTFDTPDIPGHVKVFKAEPSSSDTSTVAPTPDYSTATQATADFIATQVLGDYSAAQPQYAAMQEGVTYDAAQHNYNTSQPGFAAQHYEHQILEADGNPGPSEVITWQDGIVADGEGDEVLSAAMVQGSPMPLMRGMDWRARSARGVYNRWTPEDRIMIGKACAELGLVKATRELSKTLKRRISTSTAAHFHKLYLTHLGKQNDACLRNASVPGPRDVPSANPDQHDS